MTQDNSSPPASPNAANSEVTNKPAASEGPGAEEQSQIESVDQSPLAGPRNYTKLMLLFFIAGIAGVLVWQFGNYIQLDYLATQENQLREFQQQYPMLVFGAAFLIYVVVTGMSLPGAAPLTLVYGWYFGFTQALILVSFASTTGATIAFLTSRYLLRESIQAKFGERIQVFNQHLEHEGAFYLFTLRLIPVVPFFVINLVMGLTPVPTRTYWWISQLGMLPGTAVYVYAGSSVPNLTQLAEKGVAAVLSPEQLLQLFIAFALLGIFPLVVKQLLKFLGRRKASPKT